MAKPLDISVTICGVRESGKTSLFYRLSEDKFPEEKIANNEQYKEMTKTINGIDYHITLFERKDEDFRTEFSTDPGLHGDILLFLFSVTDKETFDTCKMIYDYLYKVNNDAVMFFVGNMVDGENRAVTKEEGMEIANDAGSPYMEISCKTGAGIKELIEEAMKKVMSSNNEFVLIQSLQLITNN